MLILQATSAGRHLRCGVNGPFVCPEIPVELLNGPPSTYATGIVWILSNSHDGRSGTTLRESSTCAYWLAMPEPGLLKVIAVAGLVLAGKTTHCLRQGMSMCKQLPLESSQHEWGYRLVFRADGHNPSISNGAWIGQNSQYLHMADTMAIFFS